MAILTFAIGVAAFALIISAAGVTILAAEAYRQSDLLSFRRYRAAAFVLVVVTIGAVFSAAGAGFLRPTLDPYGLGPGWTCVSFPRGVGVCVKNPVPAQKSEVGPHPKGP